MSSAPARLRVATFTSLFPNSQQPLHGLFVWERIKALARFAEVCVVAPVPWTPPVSWLGERYYRYSQVPSQESREGMKVEHPRFFVIPRIMKAFDGLLMGLTCLRAFAAIRRRFDFDLIDAHWAYPDGVAAAILAKIFRVPLALTVRGDDVNVFPKSFWRRQSIRWALRSADIVIALSQDLRKEVQKLGVDGSRIAVVPNGVDVSQFSLQDSVAARRRLGVPAENPILLSVGRLHHSKGFPVLVEAIALLRAEVDDLTLVIAGAPDPEANAEPAITETAKRLQVTDRVLLIGSQPPSVLLDWYNAADLFCLATEREGCANVLLEALACGLPCITTPAGGNTEIVSRQELGILVPGNAKAVAAAILSALRRKWDRRTIANHMLSRTWSSAARAHYSQLLKIVGRRDLQAELQG